MNEENEGGLHYALNAENECVRCRPGLTGPFRCFYCGAELHQTHKIDNYYFACLPGESHDKSKACWKIVKRGKDYTTKRDPEALIGSLLVPPVERGPRGPIKPPVNPGGGTNPPIDNGPRLTEIRTLDDFINAGVLDCGPRSSLDGIRKLSDYVILPEWGDSFFTNSRFDLGRRILYARFDFYNDIERILIFSMFKAGCYHLRLCLSFADYAQYVNVRDMFTELAVQENNTTRRVRRQDCKDALIAGDWVKIKKPECKTCLAAKYNFKACLDCLGLYTTQFTSARQLKAVTPRDSESSEE